MFAQTTCPEKTGVPAMATLAPRAQVVCAACRGTGATGRTETLERHGDTVLVFTKTTWCRACAGLGQIFRATAGRLQARDTSEAQTLWRNGPCKEAQAICAAPSPAAAPIERPRVHDHQPEFFAP